MTKRYTINLKMSYVLLLGRIQGILLSRKCALSEQYPCSFSDYDVLEA